MKDLIAKDILIFSTIASLIGFTIGFGGSHLSSASKSKPVTYARINLDDTSCLLAPSGTVYCPAIIPAPGPGFLSQEKK